MERPLDGGEPLLGLARITQYTDWMEDEVKRAHTAAFLAVAKVYGLTKICIGARHESVPASIGILSGVFSEEHDIRDVPWCTNKHDYGCTIWTVAKEVVPKQYLQGCGNSNQYQIDTRAYMCGCYHLINGSWEQIEGAILI